MKPSLDATNVPIGAGGLCSFADEDFTGLLGTPAAGSLAGTDGVGAASPA